MAKIGFIIIILVAPLATLLIASAIKHSTKLKKEASRFLPPGRMVALKDQKLHVYTAGKGKLILVFLAGHGTSCPTLDFKPLWLKMMDEYRIAVVERPGYGWSETSDNPRDINTMLQETREALRRAGEKGPYVLMPHSMSGLEAIYWAQQYPEEVKAIVGLDPCTPETIGILPEPKKVQLAVMYVIARVGLARLMSETDREKQFPLLKSDAFTNEDKQNYIAAFFKNAFSKDMMREIKYLKPNAVEVANNETPVNTPMCFFISHDQEQQSVGWKEILENYLSHIKVTRQFQLDTTHYVHHEKADFISVKTKQFLKELDESQAPNHH